MEVCVAGQSSWLSAKFLRFTQPFHKNYQNHTKQNKNGVKDSKRFETLKSYRKNQNYRFQNYQYC